MSPILCLIIIILKLLMHAGAQDYKHEVDPDLLDYADSNYGTKSSLVSLLCLVITLIV